MLFSAVFFFFIPLGKMDRISPHTDGEMGGAGYLVVGELGKSCMAMAMRANLRTVRQCEVRKRPRQGVWMDPSGVVDDRLTGVVTGGCREVLGPTWWCCLSLA